jgi:regulator of sirC expression with transglutaminase-like and TPR domain
MGIGARDSAFGVPGRPEGLRYKPAPRGAGLQACRVSAEPRAPVSEGVESPPVKYSLHLQSRSVQVAADLERVMNTPGEDLAPAALAIARVEYPSLDTGEYLDAIERMGDDAAARVERTGARGQDAIKVLNEYLYDEQRFTGNRQRYDDPRNSFLNEVLDRRTGIPISLAVVYLEVARRAGVHVAGVNFPGHFLLRAADERARLRYGGDFLIVDPFHGGALLSEGDCREMLRQHVGEDAAFDRTLLEPATRHEIVVRMLVNLKRLYVRMRSFPQARFVADLLLTVDPSAVWELRDRGLLAYQLEDFGAALRDLETYLRLMSRHGEEQSATDMSAGSQESNPDSAERPDEGTQVWEHIKNLRKRVAGFN